MLEEQKNRCDWCLGDEIYVDYHDGEWGSPLYDDQKLFEFLLLEGAQAGLSWITVLHKRENYRLALDQFDPEKIASYDEKKRLQLRQNPGIIRNRLKIKSAINNAQRYLDIQSSDTSFSDYLWRFVEGKPVQNRFRKMAEIPTSTETSDLMSKTLKKAGFNFVGSTICYAFMQATGMVNDHLVSCFRHEECQ
ncbi:MAG TPA: DNA-3-methyladenine glycosylase I [Pseudomonadales bacterium]|nr:DNA-3-methyladenine glycosylase I [Gammaproteobacteria bacterium]MDP6025343.1 DNA-3-methyladenine glycosylase I [Pseudomonadales bacterium]MDP6315063.1 DNA-3-methyladenine glycosylase I [Pseudomonadales bacterium]MDP7315925.1 DNA-3-methyladenine glycosylase I [Pseudomonadales bacterium]HJP52499.1 DNA-3-methyladenine glycosylase I [Pseudomonadales bacterium]